MRPRNTLSRSGISTPPLAPPRDPDLLDTDQWLTPADLDDIWEWFHTALSQNVDTEFVFVKVVNAARNPYRRDRNRGKHGQTAPAQDLISLEQDHTRGGAQGNQHDIATTATEPSREPLRESQSSSDWAWDLTEVTESLEDPGIVACSQPGALNTAAPQEVDPAHEEQIQSLTTLLADRDAELARQQEELVTLRQKLNDLTGFLAEEHLHSAELYRAAVRAKTQELAEQHAEALKKSQEESNSREAALREQLAECQRQLAEAQANPAVPQDHFRQLAHLEQQLATTHTELRACRTQLAQQARELENKKLLLRNQERRIDAHDRELAGKLAECEERVRAEQERGREALVAEVRRKLALKALTPEFLGLEGGEWRSHKPPVGEGGRKAERVDRWR